MQSKELSQINLISQLFRCSTKRKCLLPVYKDNVVSPVNVVDVVDVVFRQKTSFSEDRSCRTCWIFVTSCKQTSHATSCGKLALFYNDTRYGLAFMEHVNSHFRRFNSNEENLQTLKEIFEFHKIELLPLTEVLIKSNEGKSIDSLQGSFGYKVMINGFGPVVTDSFPLRVLQEVSTRRRYLIFICATLNITLYFCLITGVITGVKFCSFLFFFIFSRMMTSATSATCHTRLTTRPAYLLRARFLETRGSYDRPVLQYEQPQLLRSSQRDNSGSSPGRERRESSLRHECGGQGKTRRQPVTLELFNDLQDVLDVLEALKMKYVLIQVNSFLMTLLLIDDCISSFPYLCTFFTANERVGYKNDNSQQASKNFACPVRPHFLPASAMVRSSSTPFSCLRRSFLEECLNIIEKYTWLILLDSKFDSKFDFELYFDLELDSDIDFLMHVVNASVNCLYRYLIKGSSGLFTCHCYSFNLSKILLLLCGDVERNPGPNSQEIVLMTQNCRGLQDYNKL
jgi:hypothetical protein